MKRLVCRLCVRDVVYQSYDTTFNFSKTFKNLYHSSCMLFYEDRSKYYWYIHLTSKPAVFNGYNVCHKMHAAYVILNFLAAVFLKSKKKQAELILMYFI